MRSDSEQVRLACNWTVRRVRECLAKAQKDELIRFLRERYTERFFEPIRCLQKAPGNEHGYGFAIMALCCLLIETIECYREGVPTSNQNDLKDIRQNLAGKSIPCREPTNPPGSEKVFQEFFNWAERKKIYPGVKGGVFYRKIRCGLLHQAQTKGGWLIRRSGSFWDEGACSINRDEFVGRLEDCFEAFLEELRTTEWGKDVWLNVQTKICWLAETS